MLEIILFMRLTDSFEILSKLCWTKRKQKIKNMDNKILTADDARRMTKDIIEKDDSVLLPIMEKIQAAIAKKEFSCYLTGVVKDYVIEKLHKLGYTTKLFHGDYSDPRDGGDYYEISWR